jgi:hypothetical protein
VVLRGKRLLEAALRPPLEVPRRGQAEARAGMVERHRQATVLPVDGRRVTGTPVRQARVVRVAGRVRQV